jgi:hypothetical protein
VNYLGYEVFSDWLIYKHLIGKNEGRIDLAHIKTFLRTDERAV